MGLMRDDKDQLPGEFTNELTNIEKRENQLNAKRRKAGFQKFPMIVYKPAGLSKRVDDDAALVAALAKGWVEDIRDIVAPDTGEAPTKVSEMTLAQAAEFIAAAAVEDLAAIEADEASHGNRKGVMALIEAAKDAVGSPDTPDAPRKPGRPKKAA